jgi:hypothetical protein
MFNKVLWQEIRAMWTLEQMIQEYESCCGIAGIRSIGGL